MKYSTLALLIAGSCSDGSLHAEARRPQFTMLTIDTLIGTPANGCKIEYRFATIANAEKSPALRSIEAANAGYFFELEEFGGTARQAADSALRQIAAELGISAERPADDGALRNLGRSRSSRHGLARHLHHQPVELHGRGARHVRHGVP